MMFEWKPDMIRFMKDACEYGSFNRELAQIIRPYMNKDSHICDAGCGLGYLSLELAKTAGKVTAIDINENALAVLRENCALRCIGNIDILCGDVFSISPKEKYSAMVFCYFGSIEEIAKNADRLCKGPIFVFMRNYEMHRFSAGTHKKEGDGYEMACKKLRELGVRYISIETENEFGQPFKTIEDAKLFFELYSRDSGPDADMDSLLERLTFTQRDDFPLYMPHIKKTGCIIINPPNP